MDEQHRISFPSAKSYSRSTYLFRIGAVGVLMLIGSLFFPLWEPMGKPDPFFSITLPLVFFLLIAALLLSERIYTLVGFDLKAGTLTTNYITPFHAKVVKTISFQEMQFTWKKDGRAMGRSVMVLKIWTNGNTVFKVGEGYCGFSKEMLEAIHKQLLLQTKRIH